MSTWSIVCTVKANKDLIQYFLDYYLNLGVDSIYLYLDDPENIFLDNNYIFNTSINIFKCDDDFWKKNNNFANLNYNKNKRPDSVEERQTHNFVHATTLATTEWMLCVDIDELIFSEKKISEILDRYPENIFSLRLKPYEAIYKDTAPLTVKEVFDTKFFKTREKRIDDKFWNTVYKADLVHKSGFFGHITGKAFTRVNELIKYPGLHSPKPLDMTLQTEFLVNDIKLLHYEALTVDNFVEKTINRINKTFNVKYLDKPSVERINNLYKIYEEKGKKGLEKSYKEMHVFNENEIRKFIDYGVVDQIDINTQQKSEVLIQSFHGTYLAYDKLLDKCVFKDINNFESNNLLVFIALDSYKKKCFLYYIEDNKVRYLFVDRNGVLISYPKNKAMFFDLILVGKSSFNIALNNDQIFSARKDGSFKLISTPPKEWELFNLNYVLIK